MKSQRDRWGSKQTSFAPDLPKLPRGLPAPSLPPSVSWIISSGEYFWCIHWGGSYKGNCLLLMPWISQQVLAILVLLDIGAEAKWHSEGTTASQATASLIRAFTRRLCLHQLLAFLSWYVLPNHFSAMQICLNVCVQTECKYYEVSSIASCIRSIWPSMKPQKCKPDCNKICPNPVPTFLL